MGCKGWRAGRLQCFEFVDERGSDAELNLQYFSFRTPEGSRPLDAAMYIATAGAPAKGGLYLASWGDERQAIIVPDQGRTPQET